LESKFASSHNRRVFQNEWMNELMENYWKEYEGEGGIPLAG